MLGLLVECSSRNTCSSLNGLFTREGVSSMLKASNFRHVDYVSPFVSSFIDRICGEKSSQASVAFILCIDVVNWAMKAVRQTVG